MFILTPTQTTHLGPSSPRLSRSSTGQLEQLRELLQVEKARVASLNSKQLAAYRTYAGEVASDIHEVRENGLMTEAQDSFYLTEPADPNSTPRYEPQDEHLPLAEAMCSAAFVIVKRSPEAQNAVKKMAARILQLEAHYAAQGTELKIDGVSVMKMFMIEFVMNPRVTDEMLIKMGSVELKDLARTPERRKNIEERVPGCRELITHKMTVALLSAVTGIPPEILSSHCPDLGLSGTPGLGLWEPGTGYPEQLVGGKEDFQIANILHDTTDFLKDAGIDGINFAVWGQEGSIASADVSVSEAYWGGRYD